MDRETAEPRVEELPGERAREWVRYHHEFAAPATYVYDFVWDVTAEATGPFCTDVGGNVLLDFTSHVAGTPLGYNNPDLLERVRAFDLADPLKIAGQDFYAAAPGRDFPSAVGLLDRLTDVTAHYGFDTGFLTNSGVEAVENAMKICYDHTGRTRACTFEGGFHGRTMGALSVNRSKAVHRRGFPELAGITGFPFCRDQTCDPESCGCGFFPPDDPSRLREQLGPRGSLPPEDVAFVIRLLTLGCGHRTLRLIPPLDLTERETEMGATILLDALDDPSVRDAGPASTTSEDAA